MINFRRFTSRRALFAAAALLPLALPGVSRAADESAAGPTSLRISQSQYEQTIADVFGGSIAINGRFEPEVRDDGLAAVGAARAGFSEAGLQRYDDLARGIAKQVVDENHRDSLIPCKPQSQTQPDDSCSRAFISTTGRLLFRRPLSGDEVRDLVQVAHDSADKLHSFYSGIAVAVRDLLISPEFLFRYKTLERDPNNLGKMRMDAFSKATALSYFLWNSTPDDLLLKSAESGEIQTPDGLRKQVDRMVSSPAVEYGVRAFFYDMLGFSQFEVLAKDPAFFPRFTARIKDDAQEQTLRTLVDHLITRQGDYRDVFTTPNTFLTRSLAALYNVPLIEKTDNGQPMHWQPYTYPEGDPRAGLLAEASFVALYSPAGRTSPTGRGKALREYILCQMVPAPPANVDFKFVSDTSNPLYKTTRDRLTAHRTNPVCAGCHKITDPIGLALENFDSAGGYRTTENGVTIDTSGELSGVKFNGPIGLAKAIHDEPAATSCVAKRVFGFAAGRAPDTNSPEWLQIERRFSESKYNFPRLLREVALSNMLYEVQSGAEAGGR